MTRSGSSRAEETAPPGRTRLGCLPLDGGTEGSLTPAAVRAASGSFAGVLTTLPAFVRPVLTRRNSSWREPRSATRRSSRSRHPDGRRAGRNCRTTSRSRTPDRNRTARNWSRTPARSEPVHSTPAHSELVHSTPARSELVHSTPAGSRDRRNAGGAGGRPQPRPKPQTRRRRSPHPSTLRTTSHSSLKTLEGARAWTRQHLRGAAVPGAGNRSDGRRSGAITRRPGCRSGAARPPDSSPESPNSRERVR